MRFIVAVNDASEVGNRQTTALLVAALLRQDSSVWLVSVDGLSIESGGAAPAIRIRGLEIPATIDTADALHRFVRTGAPTSETLLGATDRILIRTNPGRDLARHAVHTSFLHLCQIAEQLGLQVVNAPLHLPFFASKSSLAILSQKFRPPMVVTANPEQIVNFVASAPGECVIKPLVGSRGEGVIRVENPKAAMLRTQLESEYGNRTLIAQHFITSDHPGDLRIVVVEGSILEVAGHIAGINRRPAAGDFRGNLHAGGTAHPVVALTVKARAAVEHAAAILQQHGIWLAGVDLIGDQIIEVNVFSTGGLFDAIRFTNVDFADTIAKRLIAG